MAKFFVSAGVGIAAGAICFFLSVAFLSLLLLATGAMAHIHTDLSLSYKAAAPTAILAALTGFVVTMVRAVRRPAR
ncbi:MAG TPA: hypothetical protein VKZ53_01950 [Candidatus Angelobacter sp.]|nr:hypothetical protein [Candidatus Angelobacter sp.]